MSVVVTAIFFPAEGRAAEVASAIRNALPPIHAEAGCRYYALHEAADGTLVLIEKWDSVELLDAHSSGAPVAAMRLELAPLVARPASVTRLSPLPGGDPAKGEL